MYVCTHYTCTSYLINLKQHSLQVLSSSIFSGVDASPLMTWGTIEGTPLHIDTDVTATPGQVFKIPKESVRDGIGLKLASKASKSQREKKKAAMAQATSTILGRFVNE